MKVKNIMFSGFAAAILMGVAVEANAVPTAKIVASKGYVDTITGKLDSLPTTDKNSLVNAIIELDTVIDTNQNDIAELQSDKEDKANKTDTVDENSTTTQYPSAKAVYSAIQASEYDDTALAGRVTANEGNITSLQSDKEDKANKTNTINGQSTTTQYPSAAAVYNAIENVAAQIPAMPDACQGTDNVCVLTSEDGAVYWSVLAKPYSNVIEGEATTIENGITAQQQLISTDSLPEAVSGM